MGKLNNASQTREMKLNYKEVIPAPLEEFDIEFEATGTAPVVGQEPPLITVVHNGLLGVEPKWSQTLNLVPTAGIPTARWGFVNPRPSFYSLEGIENSAELMSQRLWAALSEAPPAAANWNDPNRPN